MSLSKVRAALQSLTYHKPYFIPSLWKKHLSETLTAIEVSPKAFYTEVIDSILDLPKAELVPTENGEWSRSAVIYNLFPRLTAAFDHNQNKRIDVLPDEALRETGTFLKCIALLPYIKSLGATVVHLLPITSIGKDGNKGSLGSPYAIKNPYKLDERLSEPALNLDVETEFAAFVEAAHHLGLRVVLEFVFRTSAKDGDWVKEHPEWFYWIDNRLQDRSPQHRSGLVYGNPIFSREEIGFPLEIAVGIIKFAVSIEHTVFVVFFGFERAIFVVAQSSPLLFAIFEIGNAAQVTILVVEPHGIVGQAIFEDDFGAKRAIAVILLHQSLMATQFPKRIRAQHAEQNHRAEKKENGFSMHG